MLFCESECERERERERWGERQAGGAVEREGVRERPNEGGRERSELPCRVQ